MHDPLFDAQERLALCDLFEELGAGVPTMLDGWTADDLAAHIVLRERDLIAGPCIVLPEPCQRFAERRRVKLAAKREFCWLVARIRSGPPPGFFRIGWVRSFPNLNEFFVHHEDLRRANGLGPRSTLAPDFEAALWRNVRLGGRHLSRRLRQVGLEIRCAGTEEQITVRTGDPTVRLTGSPGELLLDVFGRKAAARVEVTGPADAVANGPPGALRDVRTDAGSRVPGTPQCLNPEADGSAVGGGFDDVAPSRADRSSGVC